MLLSLVAVAFSCAIATFPGERQEDVLEKWDPSTLTVRAHNAFFSGEPDPSTHRRFPFSNTLVLPGQNVYEGLGIAEPEKAKWRDFVFRPRGRDFRGAIFAFASLPRVDFYGADLRGARFLNAELEGASFKSAQLQGARLDSAQLEGASLKDAWLQGASLEKAQLQGALLENAQLQGALLKDAKLQGARLESANLQGASLEGAQLQGALLTSAQLQGASFATATLTATALRDAYLWRSNQEHEPGRLNQVQAATVSAIDAFADDHTWRPRWRDTNKQDRAWDERDAANKTAYEELNASLQSLPSGPLREAALTRIEVLNCSKPYETLQSCNSDPAETLPKEAADWKNAVMANPPSVKVYHTALAKSLRSFLCSGDVNEALVLRTVADPKSGQLQKAGAAARDLIDDLLRKDNSAAHGLMAEFLGKDSNGCPVAASLTDADRAPLLKIKQENSVGDSAGPLGLVVP